MFGMYLLGFASVWAAVGLVSAAVAGFRHFEDDWDRAFKRELLGRVSHPSWPTLETRPRP